MIRSIFAASWNGAALAPRFAPYETAIDVELYLENVPANDVLPEIRATDLGSADRDATKRWMLLRRLAFPRTAACATKLPRKVNVRGPP